MPSTSYWKNLDWSLIIGMLLLSNISALFALAWLSPVFVITESVLWLILAAISVWILKEDNITFSFFENLKRNWIILPFLVFSGLSIFWSVYWQISLSRWLTLFCTIIAGYYIGARYTIYKFIELLSVFGIYILFISSIFVFFAPNIGVMNYHTIQGAWQGIYWHKNHMGLIASFNNILFLINVINALRLKKKGYLFWGFLYLFSLFFVYQSDSAAAYFTTIILHGLMLLALIWLKFRMCFQGSHYFIFIMIVIIGFFGLFANVEILFGVFNRNTTLTGRVPMWTHLFENFISQRPILGYGFNAFWYLDSHRVALQQAAGYPDPIVIADNGFIDILVNTGFVGLILFSVLYLGIWWHSIKFAGNANNLIGIFPLILISYTLLANISWSLIFENESFFMLIMVSVLFRISSREVDNDP